MFNWTQTRVCNNNNNWTILKTQSVRQTSTPRSIIYWMNHTMIYTFKPNRYANQSTITTHNTKSVHPETSTSRGKTGGEPYPTLLNHTMKSQCGKHVQGEKRFQTQTPSTYTLVAVLTLCSFQLLLQVCLPQASPIELHRCVTPIARTTAMQWSMKGCVWIRSTQQNNN